MNPYRLLRPDGDPSAVWACGQCHRPHIVVIGNSASASDSSRERAESCCVPRNCGFCGKPTERNVIGDYPPYHDTCMAAARRPDLSHPSMRDPWARLLFRRMSELSEECHAAGWLIGNEFLLWRVLEGSVADYGGSALSAEELEELRVLSQRAGGWIWTGSVDEHLPRLLPLEQWAERVAEAADPAD